MASCLNYPQTKAPAVPSPAGGDKSEVLPRDEEVHCDPEPVQGSGRQPGRPDLPRDHRETRHGLHHVLLQGRHVVQTTGG